MRDESQRFVDQQSQADLFALAVDDGLVIDCGSQILDQLFVAKSGSIVFEEIPFSKWARRIEQRQAEPNRIEQG
jgi:hypothetical protein